ncbi:SAM-dependent methyltransferase [Nonomuraea basaltis]|nr:SAM-dependent methyltransferase [Nonomuraea basaltis]
MADSPRPEPVTSEVRFVPKINPNVPNVARMYDYYLGGKDNYGADRQAAEQILKTVPEVRAAARANRAFLGRAVRHVAKAGIRQFIDIGPGLPTQENVHQVAAKVAPGSQVVYVDNDPTVLVHARALLKDPNVIAVEGDLKKPDAILNDPDLTRVIDFSRPVAMLLVAIMHFIAESERPQETIATLREAMAPGSYLVMSHGTSDARPDAVDHGTEVYSKANAPLTLRSRERIMELFEGFELVDPGLVWLPEWHGEDVDKVDFPGGPESSLILGGVGRRVG